MRVYYLLVCRGGVYALEELSSGSYDEAYKESKRKLLGDPAEWSVTEAGEALPDWAGVVSLEDELPLGSWAKEREWVRSKMSSMPIRKEGEARARVEYAFLEAKSEERG